MELKKRMFKTILLTIAALTFHSTCATAEESLVLREGDRFVLCGDSITSINKYAVELAYYIEACRPELKIRCYQNALSGESSQRFLRRMQSNCIDLWQPTVVTISYHNDSRLDPDIRKAGETYRANLNKVIDEFEKRDCRVILSSSAILGPDWDRNDPSGRGGVDGKRFAHLSTVTKEEATRRKLPLAEVEEAMLIALAKLKERHGQDYDIVRADGGHSDWHGQMAIAIAFLRAMGFRNELAHFEFDMSAETAKASEGHRLVAVNEASFTIESRRYPFRFLKNHPTASLDEMWDVAECLGFFDDLNRFTLIVSTPESGRYEVSWGTRKKVFTSEELAVGINLLYEFPETPFRNPAGNVFNAIRAKFKIQQLIERGTLQRPANLEWLSRTLRNSTKIDEELRLSVKDSGKMNALAEAHVAKMHVPVTHTITLKRIGD